MFLVSVSSIKMLDIFKSGQSLITWVDLTDRLLLVESEVSDKSESTEPRGF